MTELNPVIGSRPVVSAETAAPSSAIAATLLPEPLASAFTSSDPLAQMMMTLQQSSDTSLSLSALRIHDTQSALREKLEAYLEKLQEMCDKLRAAQEDDGGGWFSDAFDFVGDLIGEIAGTLTDLQVDLVTLPEQLVLDVVNNIKDPAAMMQALQTTSAGLFENGQTAEDVHGFTQGVVSFAADFTELTARMQIAVARGALNGESLDRAIAPDLHQLLASLKHNLLDNQHFWSVVNAVGKGVAVAAAAGSGGALAPVAIGLMVLMEADQRFGVIEKVAGEKAAPSLRLGLGVATAACLAFGGASNHALALLQKGTALLNVAHAGYSAYRTLELGNERAEQLEDQAELTSRLNGMQRLQRLLDELLTSLDDDQASHERTQKLGAEVIETKMAGDAAMIFSA